MKKLMKYLFLIIVSFVSNTLLLPAQNRWESFGLSFDRPVRCFYSDTTEKILYVAGEFKTANGTYVQGIIKIDSTGFHSLGSGINFGYTPEIRSIIKYHNDIYVCGNISKADSININAIAKWNGTNWDSLQLGVTETNHLSRGTLYSMAIYNNELCVVGSFSFAGNVSALSVARWNGTTWSDMFGYPGYNITSNDFHLLYCMSVYNNELYVGGSIIDSSGTKKNGIMRWTGVNWEIVGGGITGNQSDVYCMAVYKNELYVGGCFNKAEGNTGNGIQKWNGQEWKEVGNGVTLTNYFYSAVRNMFVFNDQLFITGDFDKAGSIPAQTIASWNGSKWCALTNDTFTLQVRAFSDYKDTLIMGGWFMINNDTNLAVLVKYLEPSFTDTCSQTYGVQEIVNERNFIIFPNPATNYFKLITGNTENQTKTVNIYTIEGVLIKQVKYTDNEIMIETNEFPAGIFIIELKTKENNCYKKVVITK